MTVLASTLSNKPVMRSDGKDVGTVRNVTGNVTTGELESILVTPSNDSTFGFEQTDDGLLRIPVSLVESVDDYLMLEHRRQQNPSRQRV
ncbi:PRC-barrel domain-containing protein [Natrarchaeobaculum aegyptiacum]|uniref:PRC-barrel domain-containing protein n=1 Tax=Natrarchaeobaculum aegyptiacum TaxID=745377 RepID=A0A2Z2HY93_9EURY|nr:PRC-barrel domain-containing protein [Natrarchaeobaculum aegyptiacum]ARS91305.1 hypothetical protein B1756_17315 [Natrarchaeobaculum aegyptiacum]